MQRPRGDERSQHPGEGARPFHVSGIERFDDLEHAGSAHLPESGDGLVPPGRVEIAGGTDAVHNALGQEAANGLHPQTPADPKTGSDSRPEGPGGFEHGDQEGNQHRAPLVPARAVGRNASSERHGYMPSVTMVAMRTI